MYKFKPKAIDDIENIDNYTLETFGKAQADKYYNLLFSAFKKLDIQPSIGTDYSSICENLEGYRMESHVIFYTRKAEDIEIIRILHKSMDYIRHV